MYFFACAARIAHCKSHLSSKTIIKIKSFLAKKIKIAHSSFNQKYLWIEFKRVNVTFLKVFKIIKYYLLGF